MYNNKKTIAFVPLKLNNERLPGKNTKLLSDGTPLISLILKTLQKVHNIDDIYVYCSNESVVDYLPHGVKYLKRSAHLDLSTTKINEVLSAFAKGKVRTSIPRTKNENFSHLISMGYQ